MRYTSHSIDETFALARTFIAELPQREGATVVALTGDLGAGKTAFSQAIGQALGVRDPIQSPTFLIEKIYELYDKPWKYLIHIDAYRLDDPGELLALGWESIASRPENLILVEWADKVPSLLPLGAVRVAITGVDESTREIDIDA